MIRARSVFTGISTIAIIVSLAFLISCNRDQSSSSPPAVTQSAVGSQAPQPGAIPAPQATPMPNIGPQNYSQIQIGMNSQQVLQIMGNPSRVKQEGRYIEWEYYLAQGGKFELKLQNDKVISTKSR